MFLYRHRKDRTVRTRATPVTLVTKVTPDIRDRRSPRRNVDDRTRTRARRAELASRTVSGRVRAARRRGLLSLVQQSSSGADVHTRLRTDNILSGGQQNQPRVHHSGRSADRTSARRPVVAYIGSAQRASVEPIGTSKRRIDVMSYRRVARSSLSISPRNLNSVSSAGRNVASETSIRFI
jgi:hypothetical protein